MCSIPVDEKWLYSFFLFSGNSSSRAQASSVISADRPVISTLWAALRFFPARKTAVDRLVDGADRIFTAVLARK